MVGEKAHKASDSIGTLHVAHFVPFENNHLGFFTVYDGSVEKYFQDFADKTSFTFDTLFPNVVGAPPTPVAKNAQAFLQWGIGKQLSGYRVLQRLSRPLGSRHSSPAGRSQVTIGYRWIAVVSHGPRVKISPEVRVGKGEQNTSSTGEGGPGASSPNAWSKAA